LPGLEWLETSGHGALPACISCGLGRTYPFNQRNGENDIPGVYALCVITLFPLLNLSSFIFIHIDIFNVKN
jgi:hypothetical protein